MHSALYLGWVKHWRRAPCVHGFRYPLFMVYLDLAELPMVFADRWLWRVEKPALASFRRSDHLGDSSQPLADAVRDLVALETGARPEGPVRLLTHLRYFGYCFNPVSFYYCFDLSGQELVAIVAEVNNTPWGERHCYVLSHEPTHRWQTPKRLHVSPFMPMDMRYDWYIPTPANLIRVDMRCESAGEAIFSAHLELRRREMTAITMAMTLLHFPFMTLRVILAIHWQAFRLWCKRVPIYAHPVSPK